MDADNQIGVKVIDQIQLKELLDYDEITGVFTWKKRHGSHHWIKSWNARHAGKEAFSSVDKKGYKCGSVLGVMVKAHRVAWLYVHGVWPDDQIDHLNGIRHDNRIINLRDVSNQDNGKNATLSKRNSSGVTGVHWRKSRDRWIASIRCNGKLVSLGSFCDFNEAVRVRKAAEVRYGFHENHGKPLTPT